ncbi:MAG: diguanylate cyclase [Lachnospiraceae bacterium]|nr:diguanylate cyclase [Lachnospiraceae bacterium]
MGETEFINSIVENFIGGICAFNINSKTLSLAPVYLNSGLYRMLGGNKTSIDRMFSDLRISVIPDDTAVFEQGIKDILADDGPVTFAFRIVNTDGGLMWLRINGNLYSRDGDNNTIVSVITDCTEEMTIEEELKRQSDYMSLLIGTDITFDFNCRTDVCVFRYAKSDSYTHDEVIQGYVEKLPTSGIHEEDVKAYAKVFTSALYHSHRDTIDFRANSFNDSGEYRWYRANIVSIMGKEGYVSHVIGHIKDIHEDKLKEIELQLRADHDGLTGLMNKKATEELIERIIPKYEGTDDKGALLIFDTDNFKGVNDNFGHSMGDHVLATIGEIIRSNFKGRDVTGRIGGDEFLVFANNIGNSDNAALLAGRIEEQVMHAFDGEEVEGKVSLSIGIAMFPADGTDFSTLYKHADEALYFVKEHGKAGWNLYSNISRDTVRLS